MNLITQKPIRGFSEIESHELVSVLSPLLDNPVADSTMSAIVNHSKKLLHTYLHLLVRIPQLITLGKWLISVQYQSR